MFSKKICASLCALGLSLGAANIDTKVSAADTFASIAAKEGVVSGLWNYFKFTVGAIVFAINKAEHDIPKYDCGDDMRYKVIAALSGLTAADGFFNMIYSFTSEDEAKIKTFEAMAKNDPVYGCTYDILKNCPIELSDKNVKGVIDNVRKGREAAEKMNDRNLDPAGRLLAKDEVEDAIKNLEEIASAKNSKSIDKQNDSNEPQLYKRRNG